ncbi:hypothetical protein FISHEDRAFT_38677, partial [Fistulina hepatica ATCC 64428]
PTEFEIRQRNAKFAKAAASGKNPTHASRQEKLKHKSPVPLWILAVIIFVVVGGVFFELARLIFL